MKILVLNCGSSSIKYQLLEMEENSSKLLAKGLVERIGHTDAILTHKPVGKDKYETVTEIMDHTKGIDLVLNLLIDKKYGVISDLSEIVAAGHRVAHGGEYFKKSEIVDAKVKEEIEKLFGIAPLHNPANMKGVEAVEKILPSIPQVVVFDTAFHQTIAPENYLFGIPYSYYEKDHIRKYGFHGTSHKFVAEKACRILGMDMAKSKIVTCHLGSGASIAAVLNGKCVNTSMGFSPQDGLLMGTRCGSIDPSVITYIMEHTGMTPDQVNNMINKESGLLGVSGVSNDMRDIVAGIQAGNERCRIAFTIFVNRVRAFIGEYAAMMNGVDLVVMTGGVGENEINSRVAILKDMEFFGIEIDEDVCRANRGVDVVLTKPSSRTKAIAVTTDEEYVIASDTYNLVK